MVNVGEPCGFSPALKSSLTDCADNLNDAPTVVIANGTPGMEMIDKTSVVQAVNEASKVEAINKPTSVEVFNNPTQPIVEILSAQAASTIEVKLGTPAQSIGDIRGNVAYDQMYKVLEYLCHWEHGTCCGPSQDIVPAACSNTFISKGAPTENRGIYQDIKITVTVVNSQWHRSQGILRLMMVRYPKKYSLC
jgi:hypothetical protein